MEKNLIQFIFDLIIILGIGISFVYAIGIVLRTEKRLDFSYKLTTLSFGFLLISKIIAVFYSQDEFSMFLQKFFEIGFVVFLLLGISEMRSLIRQLDGEKK